MSATFTANGNTYEIIRTNYLIAEFDKIKSESKGLNAEEEQGVVILQNKYMAIERLANRVLELESKFYETFGEDDEAIYKRAKAHYDNELKELAKFEVEQNGIVNKIQKKSLENAKKLVIKALGVDRKGNSIRTEQEANEIWNCFVEENGQKVIDEWLTWFINYLTGNDKVEDDPFVAQAKAKAEQKANMRKGISKAR